MARYVISQVTMHDGNVMELKDKVARQAVLGGTYFLGVTETPITDGSSISTVIIDGEEITASNGNIVVVGVKEFIYAAADRKWHEFGDVTNLGALALKNYAVGVYAPGGDVSQPVFTGNDSQYTPEGTVSKPGIDVTPIESSIKEVATDGSVTAGTAAAATMPEMDFQYDETNKHLTIGWTEGSFTPNVPTVVTMPISRSVSVLSNVEAELSAAPVFTGTPATIPVSGSISKPEFTGTTATITVE